MRTSVALALVAALCAISQAAAFMAGPAPLGASCAAGRLSAAAPATRRAAPVSGLSMVDIRVEVNKGEPIESALRRFKNAVSKSGHLMELRRRKRFETNKEKEIRREKEAARNRRMAKIRSQPPSF